MKILMWLVGMSLILSSLAQAEMPKMKYYVKDKRGRAVEVMTRRQIELQAKQKQANEIKGQGQEFSAPVKISKEGKVTAWIRGCNNVLVGDLANTNQDAQKLAKLKALKNGQYVTLKMQTYGSCEVGGWTTN